MPAKSPYACENPKSQQKPPMVATSSYGSENPQAGENPLWLRNHPMAAKTPNGSEFTLLQYLVDLTWETDLAGSSGKCGSKFIRH